LEKSKVIEKLFEHIVVYSYLILPLLYLLFKDKKKEGGILAIYGLVIGLLLFFYSDFPKEQRKLYQTLFTFFEYTFFTILLYYNIESEKYKKVFLPLSILFYTFQIIHYFAFTGTRIDSIPIGVESILVFIYIFLFFLENLNSPKEIYIYNHPGFWICVGLLLYLGGSFFIYILAPEFSDEEFAKYWYFNYIADTIKTFMFAISFLFLSKKTNISSTKKTPNVPYLDMP
jgi:hypothetical protein